MALPQNGAFFLWFYSLWALACCRYPEQAPILQILLTC